MNPALNQIRSFLMHFPFPLWNVNKTLPYQWHCRIEGAEIRLKCSYIFLWYLSRWQLPEIAWLCVSQSNCSKWRLIFIVVSYSVAPLQTPQTPHRQQQHVAGAKQCDVANKTKAATFTRRQAKTSTNKLQQQSKEQ